ncbi:NAD-dependent epimerase/dehydratase family protein [Belliella sp. DSM 111904]|uniref:NAD-dependent epimerase/dehydratase family protein n=1 Tax=Belliella filtrata TaxID=2923435 RepID=A0ABS9UYB7_9BACT|nr:NAD-dependent epimerase/dehydratase family protein [Belliella filtrata]MCH7408939.1 NAD-dependent epimerase/dehydratase family protein [Belliella filtrata]
MKKVLVTGAAGLLGCNVVRALIAAQYKPVCLVRKSTDVSGLNGLPCDMVYGSVENHHEILSAMSGCEAVIHAASIYVDPKNDYSNFEKINIEGTKNMLKVASALKVSKFIYISTANTLSPGDKVSPGTELNDFKDFHLRSHYLNSKYLAEQLVLEHVVRDELDAVIIHPTFMLGSYDIKPSSGRILSHGLGKKIIFAPPGGKNFVHVMDVATVVVRSLHETLAGDRFLVGGENLSYKEFFNILSHQAQQTSRIVCIPRWLFLTAAWITQILKNNKSEFNLSSARVLGRGNYYSSTKASKYFKYQPTPVTLAVGDALEWFSGKLKNSE